MSDMMSSAPPEPGETAAVALAIPAETASPTPASADMVQSVTTLDRSIKQRRDTDTHLINFWLYLFIVNPVTLGIYGIVLWFKRINRIDGFTARKQAYYLGLLEWTERYARQQGKEDVVHHELADLRAEVRQAYKGNLRPIKAGLSFLITLGTLGIYGYFVLHRLNRYWWDAQTLEQDFDDKLSQAWTKLDLMRYPLSFTLDQGKRRSYGLYLFLSFITLGIWWIVWDYKIQVDPDNLYPSFHSVEDTVLTTVRAH